MTERKLTGKQVAFVDAYTGPARGNATEAARLAGYKGNDVTLGRVGCDNLKKPQIAQAIAAKTESRGIESDGILDAIHRIAMDDGERTSDRLKALELLGKHLGLWLRDVDTSGPTAYIIDLRRGGG